MRSVVTAVIAALLVAACSAQDPITPNSGPYAQEWAWAHEDATSDFQRQALADGEISRDEYVQAYDLWLACMNTAYPPGEQAYTLGLSVDERGLYSFEIDRPAAGQESYDQEARFSEDFRSCEQGTTWNVARLYSLAATHEERTPWLNRLAQCFVDKGFRDPGYTGEDLWRDYFALPEGVAYDLPGELEDCMEEVSG